MIGYGVYRRSVKLTRVFYLSDCTEDELDDYHCEEEGEDDIVEHGVVGEEGIILWEEREGVDE